MEAIMLSLMTIAYGIWYTYFGVKSGIEKVKSEFLIKGLHTIGFNIFILIAIFSGILSIPLGMTLVSIVTLCAIADSSLALSNTTHIEFDYKKTRELLFQIGVILFLISYTAYGILPFFTIGFNFGTFIGFLIFVAISSASYFTFDKEKMKGVEMLILLYLIPVTLLGTGALTITASSIDFFPKFLLSLAYLLLFISDWFLSHDLFRKEMKNKELIVMGTYVLGQTLMVSGFIAL